MYIQEQFGTRNYYSYGAVDIALRGVVFTTQKVTQK